MSDICLKHPIDDDCILSSDDRKLIVCEENNIKITIKNLNKKWTQNIRVENCLFPVKKEADKQCDFLVLAYKSKKCEAIEQAIAIELKTSQDQMKSVEQMEISIKKLFKQYKGIKAVLVSKSFPRILTSKFQIKQKEFSKKGIALLKFTSKNAELSL